MAEQVSRRRFINTALTGVGAVSAGAIVGAAGWTIGRSESPDRSQAAVQTPANGTNGHASHTPSPAAPVSQVNEVDVDEMDRLHKEGVDLFLENQETPITAGKGGELLESTMDDGVRVFNLTCDEVQWEVSPGRIVSGRGYNNAIPGPIIRATEGERVRINVTNNLVESTSVHWHGLVLPFGMDGVPYLTQDPIRPGETFTYEFTLRNSGTHMYHSHHNAMDQVNRGLLGAFIVDPADSSDYPEYDREYIMVLNDLNHGFTINGKSFPATEALYANLGERVLIRYMNEGIMHHPMHLHGMPMSVFAKDGYPINPPQMCDTLDVAPGNRYDAIVEATEPGVWAFHCHVLNHAESEHGMFGMVTVLVVEE